MPVGTTGILTQTFEIIWFIVDRSAQRRIWMLAKCGSLVGQTRSYFMHVSVLLGVCVCVCVCFFFFFFGGGGGGGGSVGSVDGMATFPQKYWGDYV